MSDRTHYDDEIDDGIERLIDDDAVAFWVQTIAAPEHGGSIVHATGYDRDELSYEERLHVSHGFAVDHLAIAAKHSRKTVDEVAATLVQQVKEHYDTSFAPDGDTSTPPLVEEHERNSGYRWGFR